MNDQLGFGNWLRRRRRVLDLTQDELARAVGCATVTVRKLESEERRPSKQMATRLAAALGVRASELRLFIAFARGETGAEHLAPLSLEGELAFFDRTIRGGAHYRPAGTIQTFEAVTSHGFDERPASIELCVGREAELARLDDHLEEAWSGHGGLVLISGEAGAGKTTLTANFWQRALRGNPALVVAVGTCRDVTGAGDPYLPFRELLRLLTGEVEKPLAAGKATVTQAERLWRFAPQAAEVLVEHAPDLIDTFVAGKELAERVGVATTLRPDWLLRLEDLAAGGTFRALDQGRIYEQYTSFLTTLASRWPLLLILDDLHWADISSIGLLFHLSRQLEGSRILVVGAYRPEEVAQPKKGEPHDLVGVLSELQRRFGDVWIDLDRVRQGEGRKFVDALVDSEPNRLGEAFREELARLAGGHPLFTSELLREMQERGDLKLDDDGRWVAAPSVNWDTLPPRVEGVIERRIGRLNPQLRRALAAASVEGEQFTAEVIAQTIGLDKQALVQQLSGELEKQHRLVKETGIQALGSRRVSRYRFRHNLFQKYICDNLGQAERAYLHRDVAHALELLYGDRVGEIAVSLARHFREAGNTQKAVEYLLQAGTRSNRLSAYQEAIVHLNEALVLLQEVPNTTDRAQQELAAQIALGNALIATKGYSATEVVQTFTRARELCRELGETDQLYPVLDGLYRFHLTRAEMPRSLELGEQFLRLAQRRQNSSLLLSGHRKLGTTYTFMSSFTLAKKHLARALELYDREQHRDYVRLYGQDPAVTCLCYMAFVDWHLGYPDRARKRSLDVLNLARELSHPLSLAVALCFSAQLYQRLQEPLMVQALAEEGAELADKHGFALWSMVATIMKGWSIGAQGLLEEGIAEMRAGLNAIGAIKSFLVHPYFLALLAGLHKEAGRIEDGLGDLGEALATANSTEVRFWEPELYRLKGELLLLQGGSGKESAAKACYQQALKISRRQKNRPLELRATVSLSRLLQAKGDGARARRMLAETYDWFSEGFGTPDLIQAQELLKDLEQSPELQQ